MRNTPRRGSPRNYDGGDYGGILAPMFPVETSGSATFVVPPQSRLINYRSIRRQWSAFNREYAPSTDNEDGAVLYEMTAFAKDEGLITRFIDRLSISHDVAHRTISQIQLGIPLGTVDSAEPVTPVSSRGRKEIRVFDSKTRVFVLKIGKRHSAEERPGNLDYAERAEKDEVARRVDCA